jgi:anti-sigma factor ChrR (cupin superfamily)
MTDFSNTPANYLISPIEGSHAISSNEIDWQSTDTPGFWVKPLYENGLLKQRTSLMKVDAGASSELHDHQELEQIFVLSGEFSDQDKTYVSGDFIVRAPLAMHTASSEHGCTVLLIYSDS